MMTAKDEMDRDHDETEGVEGATAAEVTDGDPARLAARDIQGGSGGTTGGPEAAKRAGLPAQAGEDPTEE